mgnify:CR=1 FL=1
MNTEDKREVREAKLQNPLGIIALFASLAEVSGTIVLKFLPERIQSIFIWFVILFPVLIVLLFFYILYKKVQPAGSVSHTLVEYYRNEQNFMTSMADVIDNQQQIISIVDEINENAMPQDVKTKIQKRVQQVEEDLEEIQSGNSIVLTVNEICANTVKAFYRKVFDYLDRNNISYDHLIPYATGSKRYLINRENRHISGGEFVSPLLVDGYFVETHKSKIAAKSDITKFLVELKLKVE